MAKSRSGAKSTSGRKSPSNSPPRDPIERIAAAVERMAPPPVGAPDFGVADAFVWHPQSARLAPVAHVNRVEMSLLKGIDRMRDTLVENTERFARAPQERVVGGQRARDGQIIAG